MNMMQKMGIDPNTVEGLAKLLSTPCRDIQDDIGKRCEGTYNCPIQHEPNRQPCTKCMAERLLAEVPTKKRYELYDWDFLKAEVDLYKMCCNKGCTELKSCTVCFAEWLMEDVEVEE